MTTLAIDVRARLIDFLHKHFHVVFPVFWLFIVVVLFVILLTVLLILLLVALLIVFIILVGFAVQHPWAGRKLVSTDRTRTSG